MMAIVRRLRQIETRLTDSTGFAPYSEPWFAYWENIFDRWMAGEEPTYSCRFALAVTDRIIEQADRADGLVQ